MEIRKTRSEDLNSVMELYKIAREFMEKTGNGSQWGKNHPPKEWIIDDISKEKSYVCLDNEEIVGVFYFEVGQDPTYSNIHEGKWLNNDEYGVIHRITSNKKGAASFCINYCFEKIGNIKIDTHKNNIPMRNMLLKNGFSECGIIYLEDGDPRVAYQKTRQND